MIRALSLGTRGAISLPMKRTALRTHRIEKQAAIVAALEAEMEGLQTDEDVNEWFPRYSAAHEKLVQLSG